MEIEKVRSVLIPPTGVYDEIAERVGLAPGTVAQFFVGIARVADATRQRILDEAAKIIEERSREGLEIVNEIKAAKAAA